MEIKYKGRVTTITDNLFDEVVTKVSKAKKSNKFGSLSIYYDGVYYFPADLKLSNAEPNKPFEIQGVFYRGKWIQDVFYISEELKEIIVTAAK